MNPALWQCRDCVACKMGNYLPYYSVTLCDCCVLGAKARWGPNHPHRDSPGGTWSHETGLLQDWNHRRSPHYHCYTGKIPTLSHTFYEQLFDSSGPVGGVTQPQTWVNMHQHRQVTASLSFRTARLGEVLCEPQAILAATGTTHLPCIYIHSLWFCCCDVHWDYNFYVEAKKAH